MNFNVIFPSPALQKWVKYFWYCKEANTLESTKYMVIADGAPGIIFQIGDQSIFKNDGLAMPQGFVYGQATESCLNDVKKQLIVLGIQFRQGALQALCREDAFVLTNTIVSLENIFSSSQIDLLVNQFTLKELIESFEMLLLKKFNQQIDSDLLITFSTEIIEKRIQNIVAPVLHKELNLSERQFQRRFRRMVGVSAETYIRIKKVEKAMQILHEGTYEKLSDVGYCLNYSDQSHFIREFKQFSGFTPTKFEKKTLDRQFSPRRHALQLRRIIPY
ncbi:MAG: AraC family transcriptional regulator [Ginsengibacter sp.]